MISCVGSAMERSVSVKPRSVSLLLTLAVGMTILDPVSVCGQVGGPSAGSVFTDNSNTADSLLVNAAGLARDGQWGEAVGIYLRVMEQYGDKVHALGRDDPGRDAQGESLLSVNTLLYCQSRLATFPPEALAIYRARVDGQVEAWFRQGSERRDRTLLKRVIDESFCSSWGDEALELLGDFAFQDGRFADALLAYRRLVNPAQAGPGTKATLGLIYPDPSTNPAVIAAKILLTRKAHGEDPPTLADLAAFTARFPQAQGQLAGRSGLLSEIVAAALRDDHLAQARSREHGWQTFAGSATRSWIAPDPIDVGSFQWRIPLPAVQSQVRGAGMRGFGFGRGRGDFMNVQASGEKLLAYFPIVVGDQVVVCDDRQIVAYPLSDRPDFAVAPSGRSRPVGTVPEVWRQPSDRIPTAPQANWLINRVPRYTLTARGSRIYARLGPSQVLAGMQFQQPTPSAVVAVDQGTDGKLLWRKSASEMPLPQRRAGALNSAFVGFEGTPVATDRHLYVAMTEGSTMTRAHVACLDAETGAAKWVRFVFDSNNALEMQVGMPMGGGAVDLAHRLLTLEGDMLFYQSNMGALAALDAMNGRVRWVATYPHRDPVNGGLTTRDLSPAIVHDGLVIVAPEDASAIYAFDAETGRLVWKTTDLPMDDVIHVLGIAKGKLFATGNHVWTIDVKNGQVLNRWPDNGQGFDGYGRGLLAGEQVYWPTRTEIHVLDQSTGLRSRPPIKLGEAFQTTGGNLAVGDGYLVVAQADALVVYCQNSRLIERYREQIAMAPEQAIYHARLAQVAEATGDLTLALESLEQARTRVKPAEMMDGKLLVDNLMDQRFRILKRLAQKAESQKSWNEAERLYGQAAVAAREPQDRVATRLRLAECLVQRGTLAQAVDSFQAVLNDGESHTIGIEIDPNRTMRADRWIVARLADLIRDHGRKIYDSHDRLARELLAEAKGRSDVHALERLVMKFPVSDSVPAALRIWGDLTFQRGDYSAAISVYKQLLATSTGVDPATRALALWRIGRAYESLGQLGPSREAYLLARERLGDQVLEELGPSISLRAAVAERLSKPPFDQWSGEGLAELAVPLSRRWTRSTAVKSKLLPLEGSTSLSSNSPFLQYDGGTGEFQLVSVAGGEPAWKTKLPEEPTWAGTIGDQIILGLPTRLLSFHSETGQLSWEYNPTKGNPSGNAASPFPMDEPPHGQIAPEKSGANGPRDVRIVGDRVFCRLGRSELLAINGETGLIDWTFSPVEGKIGPCLGIGAERILLQLREPNSILVLETETGRIEMELARGPDEPEWPRDPLEWNSNQWVIVPNRQSIGLLDLNRKSMTWTARLAEVLPRHGPPRAIIDEGRLVVLHDGVMLIRLDIGSGKELWRAPLGIEDLSERRSFLHADTERIYVASSGVVKALRWADGQMAWSRMLAGPEYGWELALTDSCLVVYPGSGLVPEVASRGVAVALCRRENGILVQRLQFPAAPGLAVRLQGRGLVIASPSGVWSLSPRRPL